MKRNRMMRIASFLLLAVLATTCVISGTFAKYTSDFTGTSNARVAKWDVTVGGEKGASTTQEFEFDLFASIKDSGGVNAEDDVKAGQNGAHIIAPGTEGSVQVILENESEVSATYKIVLTETNAAGVPIQYSFNGADWHSVDAFNEAQETAETSQVLAMTNGTGTATVYWRWIYDGNDTADTELGLNGEHTVKLTTQIVVTQKD